MIGLIVRPRIVALCRFPQPASIFKMAEKLYRINQTHRVYLRASRGDPSPHPENAYQRPRRAVDDVFTLASEREFNHAAVAGPRTARTIAIKE